MNRPSFQFYPSDWLTEPGLRICSVEARGFWIDLLCLAHKGIPYGHVSLGNGECPSVEDLSRYVGCSVERGKELLDELERHRVFSRTKEGVIYCRRMVRDEQKRENWRKWYQGDTGLFKRVRRAVGGNFTEKTLEKMLKDQSFCCYYCKKKLPKRPVLDHKIPISRGGGHELENLAFCCKKCNAEKGIKTEDEYYEYLGISNKNQIEIKSRTKKSSNRDPTRSSSSSSSSSSVTKIPTGSSTDSAGAELWPGWYDGITWSKKTRKVAFTDEAKRELAAHLAEIAEEEKLLPLNRQELQRGWGRLNGNLLRNRQCRGPKSLPAIVVNWFENDLRDPARIRGPTTKRQRTDDAFAEALRKAEEEEHGTTSDDEGG